MERIAMPQLGETVTEGTITRWLKQVGDAVAEDDVLFEVSTDKVDTEVPSAYAGVIRAIYVPEGETVPIGRVLAVITPTADEPFDESAEEAPRPPQQEPVVPVTAPAPPRGVGRRRETPPARNMVAGGEDAYRSPVVQRLLDEYGLDATEVVGTGRDGRITRADVVASAANRVAWATRPPPPFGGPPPFPPGFAPYVAPFPGDVAIARPGAVVPSGVQPGPDDEVVEFTRARRNTAEHMMRSQATSAHTLVVVEVDYARLESVRKRAKLTYLPFVARAVLMALREFPHLNASVGDDCLVVHRRIHLGVAVDVNFEALVVPVVRDADALRIEALNGAIADLAERARRKRLGADDLAGGTFSITNVGQYGTVATFPVINQPQVAILSTDGVRMRPIAVATADGEWSVAVHPTGNLSLSFDHRAVDGAYASAFLARVRTLLETHDWATEVSP